MLVPVSDGSGSGAPERPELCPEDVKRDVLEHLKKFCWSKHPVANRVGGRWPGLELGRCLAFDSVPVSRLIRRIWSAARTDPLRFRWKVPSPVPDWTFPRAGNTSTDSSGRTGRWRWFPWHCNQRVEFNFQWTLNEFDWTRNTRPLTRWTELVNNGTRIAQKGPQSQSCSFGQWFEAVTSFQDHGHPSVSQSHQRWSEMSVACRCHFHFSLLMAIKFKCFSISKKNIIKLLPGNRVLRRSRLKR